MKRHLLFAVAALGAVSASAEVFEMKARASMTPVEMNLGDVCRFTLMNGETRTLEYLGCSSGILEIPTTEGLIATQTLTARVDGVVMPFRRYFASQESFYEPAVVNGMRIFPDTSLQYLIDTVPMRYPSGRAMRHHPWKDARFVLQDATLSMCPEKLHPWFNDIRFQSLYLPVGDCYHGGDCWLGPFAYGAAHGGMDLRMTRGDLLHAPFACDDQWMPLYAKIGRGGSSRWRGVRRFKDGTLWSINTSHVIDCVVPEHTAITNGQSYCTAAGTAIGDYDHTHFEVHLCRDLNPPMPEWDDGWGEVAIVRNDCPKGQPEFYNLDPWMIFWQTFRELRDDRKALVAEIAPFGPATTGQRVTFRSARPIPKGGTATWTFNDGTSASGAEVTHAFAKPGGYTVTLTVFDGIVRVRDAAIITVSGAPVHSPMLSVTADDVSFVELKPGDLPAWGERVERDPFCAHSEKDLIFTNRGEGAGKVELRKTVKLADGAERRTYAYAGSSEETEVTIRPGSNPGPRRTAQFTQHFEHSCGAVFLTPAFWTQHHFDGKKRWYVTNGARTEKGQFVRFSPNLAAGRWSVAATLAAAHQPGSAYWVVVKDKHGTHRIRFAPMKSLKVGDFDFAEGEGYVQVEAGDSVGQIAVSQFEFTPVKLAVAAAKKGLSESTKKALKELRETLKKDLEKKLDAQGPSAAYDPDEWFFVSQALPKRCTGNALEELFAKVTDKVADKPTLPKKIAKDGTLVMPSEKERLVVIDAWSRSVCRMFYMTWQKALHVRWRGIFERTLREVQLDGFLPRGANFYEAECYACGLNGVGNNFGWSIASDCYRLAEELKINVPRLADRDMDGRGRGLYYGESCASETFKQQVREDILAGKLRADGSGAAHLLQASLDANEAEAIIKLRLAAQRLEAGNDILAEAQTILAIHCALSGMRLAEYY